MKSSKNQTHQDSPASSRLAWIIAGGCLLLVLIFMLRPRTHESAVIPTSAGNSPTPTAGPYSRQGINSIRTLHEHSQASTRPAEEIVAEKVSRFAHDRQEIVAAMAKHFEITVPEDVNRFFASIQAGRWEETTNIFATLKQLRESTNCSEALMQLWPAIMESSGVAEQAHNWPAQKLLDYGNAVIDSLRSGMVYVGGTDAGRFIPTLLNDTSEGERHIVLTQNALANGTYLDYLKFLYGDRMTTLTPEDSQGAFQSYLADAQKRLQHDQQFPDEPKQLRPGEDIQSREGRVHVSGQVPVMAINEQLLQTLLRKNPDLSFALEESFPLHSLYAGATTLGPITELRANETPNTLTSERAAQSVDYWRSTTQNLLADPESETSSTSRDAYTKLILGQANLFRSHNLSAEAEQSYQLANSLSPANPEAVFQYVMVLTDQKRYDEARRIAQTAVNITPDNNQFLDLLNRLNQAK